MGKIAFETTSLSVSGSSGFSIRKAAGNERITETSQRPTPESSWALNVNREVKRSTQITEGNEFSDSEVVSPANALISVPVKEKEQKKRVRGTVLNVSVDSVLCEVESIQGLMNVAFPRELLPNEIVYGTPIEIGVEEVNGFRCPVIEVQNPKDEENPEIDKLAALLAEI